MKDNGWADIPRAEEAGPVNRRHRPHEVFAHTVAGKRGGSTSGFHRGFDMP
ncbi:hypothetical protein [Streptosporangium carneum]|uniref:Uncharacterized protein n=1 Tax=Streptosporangium carneum TaxID=47481 RepID=A0A9W6HYR3_9ACTN|nr:hypothetical protein [Streptosporangium carneum]GLK08850.1 hypothetical protein GCM10017600_22550 [Streptosporangium carneum]